MNKYPFELNSEYINRLIQIFFFHKYIPYDVQLKK